MSILTDISSLSEDRVLRYGMLAMSLFYPGLFRIIVEDRQMFFDTDIIHLILLSFFYSMPYMMIGISFAALTLTHKKSTFNINKFILIFTANTIFIGYIMGGAVAYGKKLVREDFTYQSMPAYISFVLIVSAVILVTILIERLSKRHASKASTEN